MTLGVSIVNFNSGDYLTNCLNSLIKSRVSLNIWVVDNNSEDDSLEKARKKFPKINYIENKENIGFGRAHNIALKKIQDEYILILNPDTEVGRDVLPELLEYMEKHPDVGAMTCKIVLENGKLDWASHRGLPTPLAAFKYYFLKDDSLYHLSTKDMEEVHEVDAVSGSFLLTRKSVLDKVGLFDEDYFMYAEDIDLCYRIKEAGKKVIYYPKVSIIHHKGVSSGLKAHSQHVSTASLETRRRSLNAFYETMKIFYKKHLARRYPFFINWLVFFGIDLKWALAKRKLSV